MKRLVLIHARLRAIGLAAVLLALVGPSPAHAQNLPQAKTDVVVLSNGDRMTGDIKYLSQGKLSFDMSSTGIVSIKWNRVVALTTAWLFEVETATGERLIGTIAPGAPETLVVTTEAGDRQTLAVESIVGLQPIRKSFFSRLDGAIDLGGSYTQSSGVAQLWINFYTKARRPGFEWRISFDDYVTFQEGASTSEQLTSSFSYARYVSNRWAVFGLAQLERNPDLGFDIRSSLIGGAERVLLRSNRSDMTLAAGLGVAEERPTEGEAETQLPALLGFRHSLFIYDFPKTTLETKFFAYPVLNQWGRWRIRADGTIKREIFKDFTVGLTIYESFDSNPSTADAKRNDVGTTLSIGYIF
ncbi:MAG: DUF481 domain-containing protein [Bacteroidales bacterium]